MPLKSAILNKGVDKIVLDNEHLAQALLRGSTRELDAILNACPFLLSDNVSSQQQARDSRRRTKRTLNSAQRSFHLDFMLSTGQGQLEPGILFSSSAAHAFAAASQPMNPSGLPSVRLFFLDCKQTNIKTLIAAMDQLLRDMVTSAKACRVPTREYYYELARLLHLSNSIFLISSAGKK